MQEGGRRLLGRIIVRDEKGRQLAVPRTAAYLAPPSPGIPYPPGLTEQERQEWLGRWRLTEASSLRERLSGGNLQNQKHRAWLRVWAGLDCECYGTFFGS